MALGIVDRGSLEQMIDYAVNNMQDIIGMARMAEFKPILKNKDGEDLALGLAIGEIYTSFLVGFNLRNHRTPNQDEKDDLFKIVVKRLSEIQNAIFKCG